MSSGTMIRHLRRNAVAYVALFVALGGTSYAALSITGRDVRDESLTGADVRDGSLTGADLRGRSLRSRHLRPGLRAELRGRRGRRGARGRRGPVGPRGRPTIASAASTLVRGPWDVPPCGEHVAAQLRVDLARPAYLWVSITSRVAQGTSNMEVGGTEARLVPAGGGPAVARSPLALEAFQEYDTEADWIADVQSAGLLADDAPGRPAKLVPPGSYDLLGVVLAAEGPCSGDPARGERTLLQYMAAEAAGD